MSTTYLDVGYVCEPQKRHLECGNTISVYILFPTLRPHEGFTNEDGIRSHVCGFISVSHTLLSHNLCIEHY